jgi:hypothetical protein
VKAREAGDVDRLGLELDGVAGRAGHQHPLRQQLAQPGHVDVDHLHRRLRNVVTPQVIDEPVDRDRPVGIDQQPREQGSLPPAAEFDGHTAAARLERAEDSESHVRRPSYQRG